MNKNIKYKKEDGLLISENNVYIPVINNSIPIWVDTNSEKQSTPYSKQEKVLNDLYSIENNEVQNVLLKLDEYRKTLIRENKIVKTSKQIRDFLQLNFRQIIIPKQEKSSDTYLFIYADTNWKIRYSECIIELEILLKNNKLELTQESTGLWARLDWDYDYNCNNDIQEITQV